MQDQIREMYESGALDPLKGDLESFLKAHRDRIQTFRKQQEDLGRGELADDVVVKLYLLRQRTINAKRDIQDQLKEIEREKWIQGINTGSHPDPQKVAREWSQSHSALWREHRVTTIIYVFEQDKERYLKLVRNS